MRTLFLAWQDAGTRRWFPVGRLTYDGTTYEFRYTEGARIASHDGGFTGLPSFPELGLVYESNRLFPLFSEKILSGSDAEREAYVEWLALPEDEDDPMAMLAGGGVRQIGEKLEIFPCPEPDEHGRYNIHFFSHGLRHFPADSIARVERMEPGDPLLLVLDIQNS
ncbi:MAG: DNA-binding protein, partial [Bacteroidota bacterium]